MDISNISVVNGEVPQKRLRFRRLLSIIACMLIVVPASGTEKVTIDQIEGLNSDSTISTGQPVTILFRLESDVGSNIVDLFNFVNLFSPDGATWHPSVTVDTSIIGFPIPMTTFDTTFYSWRWIPPPLEDSTYWPNHLRFFGVDISADHDSNSLTPDLFGEDQDTIAFVASAPPNPGIPLPFDERVWSVSLDSISEASVGMSICLDTANYLLPSPPGFGTWEWHIASPDTVVNPEWSGRLCFEIVSCCQSIRGNINLDQQDTIDISDLTYLVSWMFKSGDGPPCMLEADVDGNDSHDIADVTHLVGYMFKGGAEPVGCP